eukprot:3160016-Rhodomonas_salina.2
MATLGETETATQSGSLNDSSRSVSPAAMSRPCSKRKPRAETRGPPTLSTRVCCMLLMLTEMSALAPSRLAQTRDRHQCCCVSQKQQGRVSLSHAQPTARH